MPPEYEPEDAIFTLANGRKIVDLPKYVAAAIYQDWNPENTDGKTPKVELAEDMKAVVFRNGDFITLYVLNPTSKPVSLIYDFENIEITFSLDVFTSGDRAHMTRLIEELRRVIQGRRRDTVPVEENVTGRIWMQWGIRTAPMDKSVKGFYRQIIDCKINWRYRSIG